MIAILCAMSEERDAILSHLSDVKIRKGRKLLYHGHELDNNYYCGRLADKDVVVLRCGVGEIYATMNAVYLINRFRPEFVINVGVAGSLNEKVHVNDVVIATMAGQWRFDVPEKQYIRGFDNELITFRCDEKVIGLIKKNSHIHVGPIVSADEFIYSRSQLRVIKKYYPEALCGEMEGAAIAGVCYAHNIPVTIIRSISDETLVQDSYKQLDFVLDKVCDTAARICKEIITRY